MSSLRKRVEIQVDANTGRAQRGLLRVEQSGNRASTSMGRMSTSMAQAEARSKSMAAQMSQLRGSLAGAAGVIGGVMMAHAALDRWSAASVKHQNITAGLRIDLDKLAVAVDNQVQKMDLARGAIILQNTALQKSDEQYAKLAQNVAIIADSMGQDVPRAWEQVATAIAKGNVANLRALGISTDMTLAMQRYADAQGRSVSSLRIAEKQAIAWNVVNEELARKAAATTTATAGMAHGFQRAYNRLKDLGAEAMVVDKHLAGLYNRGLSKLQEGMEAVGIETDNSRIATHKLDQAASMAARGGIAVLTLGVSELWRALMKSEQEVRGVGGWLRDVNDQIESNRRAQVDAVKAVQDNIRANRDMMTVAAANANLLKVTKERNDAYAKALANRGKATRDVHAAERALFKAELERVNMSKNMMRMDREVFEARRRFAAEMKAVRDAEIVDAMRRDRFSREQMEEAIDRERVHQDKLLQTRLNAIEMQQEAGVDPITLIEREKEARIELLNFELEAAEQLGHVHDAELIRMEIEQEHHNARMQRMAAERAQIERTTAMVRNAASMQVSAMLSISDARFQAEQAALAEGKTATEAARAGQQAAKLQTAAVLTQIRDMAIQKALWHGAEAIGAAARYDFGGMALHIAAAGLFGAIAGGTGAGARSIQEGVASDQRRNSMLGGAPGGPFGDRGAAGQGANGRDGVSPGGVPVSHQSESTTHGSVQAGGDTPDSQSQATNNVQVFHIGDLNDESAAKIDKALKRRQQSEGAL